MGLALNLEVRNISEHLLIQIVFIRANVRDSASETSGHNKRASDRIKFVVFHYSKSPFSNFFSIGLEVSNLCEISSVFCWRIFYQIRLYLLAGFGIVELNNAIFISEFFQEELFSKRIRATL